MITADLLHHRARLTPQREALLELATGGRYTYAGLNERAKRTANWLRDYGVGLGDASLFWPTTAWSMWTYFLPAPKLGRFLRR